MFTVRLARVRDRVRVRLGHEALCLRVDAGAAEMTAALSAARRRLEALGAGAAEADRCEAARALSAAIFGERQAEDLRALCGDDPARIVTVCGAYYRKRLRRKLARAQRYLP